MAAALSLAAALIHASVIAAHFQEYWLFGIFFASTAVFQLVWAGAVWGGAPGTSLLVGGALANVAIAGLWLYSRVIGLPFGPEAGETEPIGIHDALATLAELVLALAVSMALARRPISRSLQGPALAGAWTIAVVAAISAFLGPHGPD